MRNPRNIVIWNMVFSFIILGFYLTECSITQWHIAALSFFGGIFLLDMLLYVGFYRSKRIRKSRVKYDNYLIIIHGLTLFLFIRDFFDKNMINNTYTLLVEKGKIMENSTYFIENITFLSILHLCLMVFFLLEVRFKKKKKEIQEKAVS